MSARVVRYASHHIGKVVIGLRTDHGYCISASGKKSSIIDMPFPRSIGEGEIDRIVIRRSLRRIFLETLVYQALGTERGLFEEAPERGRCFE